MERHQCLPNAWKFGIHVPFPSHVGDYAHNQRQRCHHLKQNSPYILENVKFYFILVILRNTHLALVICPKYLTIIMTILLTLTIIEKLWLMLIQTMYYTPYLTPCIIHNISNHVLYTISQSMYDTFVCQFVLIFAIMQIFLDKVNSLILCVSYQIYRMDIYVCKHHDRKHANIREEIYWAS